MKKLLIVLLLLLTGCIAKITPKAIILHPTLGDKLMVVPKHNKIGSYIAPDNGVFMTEEVFKDMVRQLLLSRQREDLFLSAI